jgi:hypothetical protein
MASWLYDITRQTARVDVEAIMSLGPYVLNVFEWARNLNDDAMPLTPPMQLEL